jgi:hypothetical protein
MASLDVPGCRIATGGPDSLISTLVLAGDHGKAGRRNGGMWRAPSPMTELVLDGGLPRCNPTKVVAKAAAQGALQATQLSWVTPEVMPGWDTLVACESMYPHPIARCDLAEAGPSGARNWWWTAAEKGVATRIIPLPVCALCDDVPARRQTQTVAGSPVRTLVASNVD